MITQEALPSVKKAAQGKLYTFRLVTVDSFKERRRKSTRTSSTRNSD